ncbi:MAG: DUF2652 domain-containing protein [Bacteroidetes bacterium]|nr:DUF2652 domain-containing protein [Bacteroidota bacterium]
MEPDQKSTIFIPDISGYTKFLSESELEHSALILRNLIEKMIELNNLDFTVGEVEGDAVLFYKIGALVDCKELVNHCIKLHHTFHEQLHELEMQVTCDCVACRDGVDLNLKFVIHYGRIKEVQISKFMKAKGLDMIVSHRLLKNSINSNEYILATDDYLKSCDNQHRSLELDWIKGDEFYADIGKVAYEYAVIQKGKQLPHNKKGII